VKAGELVVLVNDVQGVAAGKEGRVMSVRGELKNVEEVTTHPGRGTKEMVKSFQPRSDRAR